MNLLEIIDKVKEKYSSRDLALFKDKSGNIQIITIYIVPGLCIHLHSINEDLESTGYMYTYIHPDKRIFLDTLYCYHNFRGNGVAASLSELMDYLLKDYIGYIIRGVFSPNQLSTDRIDNIPCSTEELMARATSSYQKNGYQIITHDDFLVNQANYPELVEELDFQLGEGFTQSIVTKKIVEKPYIYHKIGDLIVNDNARYLIQEYGLDEKGKRY